MAPSAWRRDGRPYLVLVGIIVGSLLTALVVPIVFGESLGGSGDDLEVSGGEGLDLGPGSSGRGSATGGAGGGPGGGQASGVAGGEPGSTAPGGPTGASGADPGAPAARGASAGVPGGPLQATDVGVTPDTIKLGFLLLDVGSLSRIGVAVPGVDPEQQREAFEAQLKHINDQGGINGRKVVGVYEKFDVLSADDMRRACLAIRDQKPFAVVAAGGYQGPAVLCFTEEGQTPLITQGSHGTPTEYLKRSGGRLFTMYPHSDRLMANWVAELHQLGHLRGKKIGIISQEQVNPGNTVIGGGLVPALERFGYEPTHISQFSADQSAAASQVPVEVQQMRSKGVDLVMIAASTLVSTQFVQTADNQQFRPRYTLTDWASMNNDTSNQNMPRSYDGSILITTYRTGEEKLGVGENPAEQECRAIYEQGTGKKMEPKGENAHGLLQTNCTTLKVTLMGMAAAGPGLTKAAFSGGMQGIGEFPMTLWGGGSLGPGKFDAADQVRTAKWDFACKCILPVDDFRRSRF